jgi:hypothetical protein
MLSGIFLFGLTNIINGQAPVINSITADKSAVLRFEKIELTIQFTGAYTNPFDYDDILVQADITTPSGASEVVEGFFIEDYSINLSSGNITPLGVSQFRIRYTPRETGQYTYTITVKNLLGQTTSAAAGFMVSGTAGKGFVRKSNSNYLVFDDGSQYIMIGQNLCWQQNQKYLNFKNWTDNLAANGANFIRLWQCYWGLGLEWTSRPDNGTSGIYNGLKRYSQINAFYTDRLIDQLESKGIYMMLCINHHGMVSTSVNPEWNTSPYNIANGGPCSNTWDYFTNTTAKNLHKNRLRYIVARWGYSKNIMSWELFNEVEWTDQYNTYRGAIKSWHEEMALFLKEKDPSKHLVTTSFAHDNNDSDTWNLSAMDFTQTHYYNGSANMETVLVDGIRNYLSSFSKPTYTGEFGVNTNQSNLGTADPNGIHIHNALWATLFGGGMGTGASWWWDTYIEPRNLYHHYKAPAAIAAQIDLPGHLYKPVVGSVSGGVSGEVVISPGFGWGRSPANLFQIDASGNMSPAASNLGSYIYGSQCKSAEKNSPSFTIDLPASGEFKVRTADVSPHCNAQRIVIRVNNVERLNLLVAANTTYTVALPAGASTISLDNGGGDWFRVSSITISGIGSALNTYLLKSEDAKRAAGWVHNKKYNWIDAGPSNPAPAAITGATLSVPGMVNGTYEIKWFECSNGTLQSTTSATVAGGILTIPVPNIAWDLAFIANDITTLPIKLSAFTGIAEKQLNRLFFTISEAKNVKDIFIERSNDGRSFESIGKLLVQNNQFTGSHTYLDESRFMNDNYYRLQIIDYDGSRQLSRVILLQPQARQESIRVYPNPFTNELILSGSASGGMGPYVVSITDMQGKKWNQQIIIPVRGQVQQSITLKALPKGFYVFLVFNEDGQVITSQKILKN